MIDMSLDRFIGHIAGASMLMEHAAAKGLEHAARTLKAEAKAEIGEYQNTAGQFAGWAQLADATIEQKSKLGYAPPDNPLLRTGALRDSIDHKVDAEAREAVVGSDSEIAVAQELGTQHIPPRSFLGGAAVRTAPEIARILGHKAVEALIGREVFGGALPIR